MSSPTPGSQSSSASAAGNNGKKCIMLVDDEVAYTELLEQLLEKHLACPVKSFHRPDEALKALPELDVGLIVTDFNMPGLNGFEFLAEVRKIRPSLPAVMITAHEIELTSERSTSLPALKAVVRKPFKWMTLAIEISRHWDGSRPSLPCNV
jgi:DNA-binding NtrC family response regulator